MTGRSTVRPLWSLLAGIVLAMALFTGCGSAAPVPAPTPPPAPADQTVRDSYSRLAASGTARMDVGATTRTGGRSIDVRGEGEVDFRQRGYAFTLELPGAGPLTAVGTGGIAYLRSEQLTSRIPGGRPWVLIDPVKLRAAGPAGRRFTTSAQDPFGQLAIVRGAGRDTRVVGTETIDGEVLTHYVTTIDIARAEQATTEPVEKQALEQYAARVGDPTVPSEVWTDAQGRLRRLALSLPENASRPAVTARLGFTALGSTVTTIVVPPPDQTTDLAAAIAGR